MMRSLYSGVSGLKGHQTKMDVVGNNIANVNTTGFKSSRVTFADTLSQTQAGASAPRGNLGGTNPKQIGLGVGVASIDTIFTDGSVQATGKNTYYFYGWLSTGYGEKYRFVFVWQWFVCCKKGSGNVLYP